MSDGKPLDEEHAGMQVYQYAQEQGIDAHVRTRVDREAIFVAVDTKAECGSNIELSRRIKRHGHESQQAIADVVFDTGTAIVNELAAITRLKRTQLIDSGVSRGR